MGFFDYFKEFYIEKAFGSTYIVTELASCLCLAIAFNSIDIRKWKDWLRLVIDWAIVFVVYIFVACLNHLIYEACGNVESANLISRYYTWLIVALLHTIYPRNKTRYGVRFTFAILITTSIIYATSISGSIGSYISSTTDYPGTTLKDTTLYVILLVLLGMTILFKIFSPFKFHYTKIQSMIILNSIFMISYVSALMINILTNSDVVIIPIVQIAFILMDVLSYIIFYYNAMSYNKVVDLQSQALKSESEKSQLEISSSKYQELHEIRHELQNQMSILQKLVDEKKYDELSKYFADIYENTRIAIDFASSGNAVIDTVMDMEIAKARSKEIQLDYSIAVPSSLNIASQDLISLLTNLIDNAIEAQDRYGLKDPISISIIYKEPYLLVEVRNSIDPNVDKKKLMSLQSSKTDRLNHGYGVKIITRICETYNGASKYYLSDDRTFCFSGMLNNEMGQ